MTKYESLSLFAAYLNLLASFGGLGLLYYGIREMAKGAEMRAADSESKHTETMTASQRRHDEVMAESERRYERVHGGLPAQGGGGDPQARRGHGGYPEQG